MNIGASSKILKTTKIFFAAFFVFLMVGVVSAQTTIYTQNFDGTPGWALAGNFGVNTQTINEHSGTKCLYTVQDNNYAINATEAANYAISPAINTVGFMSTTLEYWSYSDFASNDYGYVYISGDNGVTWSSYIERYSATETGWTLHSINISTYADNLSQVKIKFTMSSNNWTNKTGWNIDDVVIKGTVMPAGLTVTPTSLAFGNVLNGATSTNKSYSLSGFSLSPASGNIVITAPANFEVSLSSGFGFGSSVNVPYAGSFLSNTTIYSRFKPTSASFYSGNISNIGGGYTTNVAVTGTGTVAYCSSSSNGASYGISSVVFGSISNSATPINTGYSDYTSMSTNVIIGNSYNLTVKLSTSGYTFYARAWIDWNKNGVFEATETYDLGSASGTNVSTGTYPIVVPTGATGGTTRMRVTSGYSSYQNPCDNNFYGEVEDYSIFVLPTITTGTITGSPFNKGDAVAVPFTTNGLFPVGNVFTAQLSNASGSFASPVSIGTLTGTGSGVISGIIPVDATAGTGYKIRVVSNTPVITGTDNGSNLTIVDGASIIRSTAFLNGFNYVVGSGPSNVLSFTVNVTTTQDLIVTPPSAFEISTASGGGFDITPITLSPVGGVISATIYVRMIAELTVGNYGPQDISLAAGGFTTKTVICTGVISPLSLTIVVGYKSGLPTDNYYAFNGTDRISAGAKLLNPVNFGPMGISPYNFILYDFGNTEITEDGLIANGIQILDMGINTPDAGSGTSTNSYNAAELNAIKNWTISTKNRVVLTFQGVTSALGGTEYVTDGTGNLNPNSVTDIGQAIMNGPFGTTNTYDQGGGYQGSYSLYPSTSCILTQAANGKPTGLVNTLTGDIYLADVGFVGVTSGLTTGSGISSFTDAFFANIYHGLARIVQYGPSTICDFFSCPAGINSPSLSATSLSIVCPSTTANLNSLHSATIPANSTLVWFTNPDHTGTVFATPTLAPSGTYYAFYYSAGSSCYSPASLAVIVESGISINTTSLPEFSYVLGNGPSAINNIFVSGTCLNEQITLTPPPNFEISTDGLTFQSIPIYLSQSSGNVSRTPIYVRLKKDLPTGDYRDNLVLTSLGATTKYVALFGTVIVASYCSSSGSSTYQTSITFVNLNTISNSSAKPSGFTYYSNLVTDLKVGSSYYLSARLKTDGNRTVYCKAWIDWNRNGVFDTTESYDLGTVVNNENGITTLSPQLIKVDTTASVGYTRMRVTCSFTAILDPCANGFDGEVEDYRINVEKNFWRGNISSDWGTETNWTAKYVPINGERVEFSTGTPYSVAVNNLVLDKNRTIGNLTNLSPVSLVIPTGTGLTINGTVNTGSNPDRILIKSGPPPAVNGSLIFKTGPVQATVEMYSRAQKITPIKVDTTNYQYAWQFFGIPVTSLTASPTFDGSYVREYQEGKQGQYNKWLALTNASAMLPTKGYEITQDAPKTIVFKGQLINGDQTISLTKSSDPLVFFQGNNIISNPYTASINVRNLVFTNAEAVVYLYYTGSFGSWYNQGGVQIDNDPLAVAGQYLAIPKRLAGVGVDLPNEIPSMSGFLVKATNATNSKVAITYSTGTTNNVYAQRVKATNNNVENVNTATDTVADDVAEDVADISCTTIEVRSQNAADKMWIITDPTCTKEFDNGWDGPKIMGSALSPQIYAVEPDGNYQVNSISDMNNTELGFQAGLDSVYTLTFNHLNLDKRYAGVYLVDLVANKTVDVTENGSVYNFLTNIVPITEKRFKIITRPYEKDASDAESLVKIFSSESSIFVQNFGDVKGECRVYDIAGHYLMKVPYSANAVTTISNSLIPGVYIAMAIAGGEKVSKQIIVR